MKSIPESPCTSAVEPGLSHMRQKSTEA